MKNISTAQPDLVDQSEVDQCATYRDAVRLCWINRGRKNMTQASLAEECGLYPSHVSDYLSVFPGKRDLPGGKIAVFQRVCRNTAITQWIEAEQKAA